VPVLVAAGLRAVAPDLVGFGRSDKPAAREDYSYQRHVDWLVAFLDGIGVTGWTLVAQDWGGLLGLRLVAQHEARFAPVVAAHTPPYRPATSARPPPSSGGRASRRPCPSCRGGASSPAAARPRFRPRWWPPTTPPSPTSGTRRARGSSRCWCRRAPTTPPRRPT